MVLDVSDRGRRAGRLMVGLPIQHAPAVTGGVGVGTRGGGGLTGERPAGAGAASRLSVRLEAAGDPDLAP
jgi:hypothetical protein